MFQTHLNANKIYEAFPNELPLIKRLINHYKQKLPNKELSRLLENINNSNWSDFDKKKHKSFLECILHSRFKNVFDHINRLEKLKRFYIAKQNGKQLVDISALKDVPITQLHTFEGLSFRNNTNRVSVSCPLHHDKTPSFVIYKKTNSFYCFSCHQGGDNIKFIQLLHNCDFKTACDFISNHQ